MSLIIFSHSDYSYLWPIIEEKIALFIDFNTIFISNKNDFISIDKPHGFKKYLEYSAEMSYANRWISILENNQLDDYFIVVHDIHIIVECDLKKIKILIDILRKNKIDRCSLNVFNGRDIIHDEINLCNLNNGHLVSNTFVPYDVGPTIWNGNSFLKLWKIFPNISYRESELNNELQNYCKKLKCYGIQKTQEKIYYCIGRPYPAFFKILILTIKGELLLPREIYMDMYSYYNEIETKYELKNKIKNANYKFVLDHFKPL
jgi:hypothetical protein